MHSVSDVLNSVLNFYCLYLQESIKGILATNVWQISRNNLRLLTVLGEGNFGKVWSKTIFCIIKTLWCYWVYFFISMNGIILYVVFVIKTTMYIHNEDVFIIWTQSLKDHSVLRLTMHRCLHKKDTPQSLLWKHIAIVNLKTVKSFNECVLRMKTSVLIVNIQSSLNYEDVQLIDSAMIKQR